MEGIRLYNEQIYILELPREVNIKMEFNSWYITSTIFNNVQVLNIYVNT